MVFLNRRPLTGVNMSQTGENHQRHQGHQSAETPPRFPSDPRRHRGCVVCLRACVCVCVCVCPVRLREQLLR